MEKRFAYHKPSAKSLEIIQLLRQEFSTMFDIIRTNCPDSREKSVAITELESCAMWAIKAVVTNDPESQIEGINTGEIKD